MPTPLTRDAVNELRRKHPHLPSDYFDYMLSVGWGDTAAGPMIYSGPVEPDEIYGHRNDLSGIVLLGDDFQGYCFGYNANTECYGEVSDDGSWEPWPASEGFACYVSEPDENAT